MSDLKADRDALDEVLRRFARTNPSVSHLVAAVLPLLAAARAEGARRALREVGDALAAAAEAEPS